MPEFIKFTDENIAAIREGNKRQTRRPVKGQPLPFGRYHVADKDGKPTDIVIEIIGVSSEQLHEITPGDCDAEGVAVDEAYYIGSYAGLQFQLLKAFKALWSTIYGPENQFAWQNNPWVWVYTFRIVE
jgi:hypothetical protein